MEKTVCGAKTRKGTPCQKQALENGKCKLHGGKSTGPKNKEKHRQSLKGNKNAVKTGEYETIAFDMLSEEEQALIQQIPDDPKRLVKNELGTLLVRRRRMMARLGDEEAKKKPNNKSLNSLNEALTRLNAVTLNHIKVFYDLSAETTDNDNGSLGDLVDILADVRKRRINE